MDMNKDIAQEETLQREDQSSLPEQITKLYIIPGDEKYHHYHYCTTQRTEALLFTEQDNYLISPLMTHQMPSMKVYHSSKWIKLFCKFPCIIYLSHNVIPKHKISFLPLNRKLLEQVTL